MIFFKEVSKDLSIKMDVLHFYKHVVEPQVSAIKLFKSFFVHESVKEKLSMYMFHHMFVGWILWLCVCMYN